jgi:hypothetical protein
VLEGARRIALEGLAGFAAEELKGHDRGPRVRREAAPQGRERAGQVLDVFIAEGEQLAARKR